MLYKLIDRIVSDRENLDEDLKSGAIAAALAGALLFSPTYADAKNLPTHRRHSVMTVRRYSDNDYINAIIGEGSNQGYNGMLALAGAIRNRMKDQYYKNNPLYDVYGKHASHIKSEPKEVFDTAKRAWDDSKNNDITDGAIIWGNVDDVEKFKKQGWFKNVTQTVRIGDHFFFKKNRN